MTYPDTKQLAGFIDHTLLAAAATEQDIKQLCCEALEHGFHTVCVNPRWVSLAAEILYNRPVKVGGVVSLPLGGDCSKIKVAQTRENIFAGADEIDMVADIASIIAGDEKYLSNELSSVLKICHSMRPAVELKVIIESAALTDEQIVFACRIAERTGVDFVKTSTGMNPSGGAKVEHIRLMKESAPHCKIKAAGGIRTAEKAIEMIEAGASRIGTSSGIDIIKQLKQGQPQ